jgi:hypothetical protein
MYKNRSAVHLPEFHISSHSRLAKAQPGQESSILLCIWIDIVYFKRKLCSKYLEAVCLSILPVTGRLPVFYL